MFIDCFETIEDIFEGGLMWINAILRTKRIETEINVQGWRGGTGLESNSYDVE